MISSRPFALFSKVVITSALSACCQEYSGDGLSRCCVHSGETWEVVDGVEWNRFNDAGPGENVELTGDACVPLCRWRAQTCRWQRLDCTQRPIDTLCFPDGGARMNLYPTAIKLCSPIPCIPPGSGIVR